MTREELVAELEEAMRLANISEDEMAYCIKKISESLGVPTEFLKGGEAHSSVALSMEVFERQMKEEQKKMEEVMRLFCLSTLRGAKP